MHLRALNGAGQPTFSFSWGANVPLQTPLVPAPRPFIQSPPLQHQFCFDRTLLSCCVILITFSLILDLIRSL